MAKKHRHHIVPKHMGGTDDMDNIIELTPERHAQAHLELYEKYGKTEDLCAYHMLSGRIEEFRSAYGKLGWLKAWGDKPYKPYHVMSPESRKRFHAAGGFKQGKINAQNGHMKKIQRLVDHSAAGKKGAAVCRDKQVNAFFDPALRKEISSKGGKVQGKRNAESGHLKRISKLGSKMRGKIWTTNGSKNIVINRGDSIPEGFWPGKTQKKR